LFQRVFDFNPLYEQAGMHLFDLQMTEGDRQAAAITLSRLQEHCNNAFVQARAVQLATSRIRPSSAGAWAIIRRRDPAERRLKNAAADNLRQICADPAANGWPVVAAVDAMRRVGWMPLAKTILEESLFLPGAPPEVGRQWVLANVRHWRWRCRRILPKLFERGKIGEDAAVAFIEYLASARRAMAFRSFVFMNKRWLRRSTATWASVGYGMAFLRFNSQLIRWMADWRERTNVQSWMLANLVEGLRAKGRDEEAAEASRFALMLENGPVDVMHRLWLAADAIRDGDLAAARQGIEAIAPDSLKAGGAFLRRLIAAVVDMASAEPATKDATFVAVRRDLRQAVSGFPSFRFDRARRRFYCKCVWRIAAYHGGMSSRLWALWCRHIF
jgi:hypothetical protein